MLAIEDSVLLVIDVQGKLASLMHEQEKIFGNIERMIKVAQILRMPILWTEQAPDKIGATIAPINDLLFPLLKPISKRSFSVYGCPEFVEALLKEKRRQVIITGIEAHVCIYQSGRDLKCFGYDVHVLSDAVSSRFELNKTLALQRLHDEGAIISTTEMTVCELLKTADHPKFREVMSNIRR